MSPYVPLYLSRIFSLLLALAGGVLGVYAALHAKHESSLTKAGAQAAVNKLGMGVTVDIFTSDVYLAGEIEGIAQLGLALLSGLIILLVVMDSGKRLVVPNAPNVRTPPFSSRTLILQLLALILATLFTLVTAAVTTHIVFTRQAVVNSMFPNGVQVPPALVAKLSAQLGISPVYKNQGYLVFLAAAGWPGFFFALTSTIITFMAWRRYKAGRRDLVEENSFNSTEKF